MTNEEARREILQAILGCEPVDARGEPYPAIREVKVAKELATSLFNSLKAKGLLIKMDDDD